MGSLRKLVLAVSVAVAMVTGYPHGAPDSACPTLNPDSHGASTATGNSPYRLELTSRTYRNNQVIQLFLRGAPFKGFLIVGRKADGSSTDPVGNFEDVSTRAKLACTNATAGNGVTQTNNTVKEFLGFRWKAPATSVGNIVFHFTVIRGGAPDTTPKASDYFLNATSDVLTPETDRHSQQQVKAHVLTSAFHKQRKQKIPKFVDSMIIDALD